MSVNVGEHKPRILLVWFSYAFIMFVDIASKIFNEETCFFSY